jgi:hypothetical protein
MGTPKWTLGSSGDIVESKLPVLRREIDALLGGVGNNI